MINSFPKNANHINELERAISLDRLSTYLAAADNNKERALQLYLWNSQISAAFYIPLQGLEITLRNTLHNALSRKFGSCEWYKMAPLGFRDQETLVDAQEKIKKSNYPEDPPHIVAELSFGFWISLLNRQYHQTLWIPAIGKSLSNSNLPRGEIHARLDHIRKLRNRIAHHETIFKRHLEQDYKNIIEFIGWMNPTMAEWIDQNNEAMEIILTKPLTKK